MRLLALSFVLFMAVLPQLWVRDQQVMPEIDSTADFLANLCVCVLYGFALEKAFPFLRKALWR